MDIVSRLAARAAKRVAAGALNGHSVSELACELGVSERHLRRAFERELGVSPLQLALTHWLLLAKRLLADTSLPVTRIAYASGFQSLRRFNAVFQEHYRMPPSALRRSRRARSTNGSGNRADLLRLTLAYRAPLAWDALADCLARDAIPGVDFVEDAQYGRTIELDGRRGAILVQDSIMAENGASAFAAQERAPGSAHLNVDISLSLVPVLMPLLARLRHLLDLDAEPTVIDSHLAGEGLGALVMRHPGMRIPGAFSGFEVAFRTLLGGWPQTDLAMKEVARRVVEAVGEPSEISDSRLAWLLPTAERVANAGAQRLRELGVPHVNAEALVSIAKGTVDGSVRLHAGGDPMEARRALLAIGGVSEQVATMIIMRALSWPDAFPIAASEPDSASLLARAERWRPWRAYATLHLSDGRGPSPRDRGEASSCELSPQPTAKVSRLFLVRVHPLREFRGVVPLGADHPCESASMIVAGAKPRDRVRKIIGRPPSEVASCEGVDVHPVYAREHPPAALGEYRVERGCVPANDVGHCLPQIEEIVGREGRGCGDDVTSEADIGRALHREQVRIDYILDVDSAKQQLVDLHVCRGECRSNVGIVVRLREEAGGAKDDDRQFVTPVK